MFWLKKNKKNKTNNNYNNNNNVIHVIYKLTNMHICTFNFWNSPFEVSINSLDLNVDFVT